MERMMDRIDKSKKEIEKPGPYTRKQTGTTGTTTSNRNQPVISKPSQSHSYKQEFSYSQHGDLPPEVYYNEDF